MGRIFGYLIGLIWIGLAFGALSRASAGFSADMADVGLWWSIIGTLLGIAATAALVGTYLHTSAGASRADS
jgi:hypothetical protein